MHSLSTRTKCVRGAACSIALLCGLAAARASAQDLSSLVEAALDQQITSRVEVSERPIREALAGLEEPTGLVFVLSPRAVELMPYGEQTRISIVMENMSVRQALSRILTGLGFEMRVEDDKVLVEPAPVLERLGRPLKIEEVELLQRLVEGPWAQIKASDIAIRLQRAGQLTAAQELVGALMQAPVADALTQLDLVTREFGCDWVPDGRGILVYGQSEEIELRLDRPLDVHYRRMPLDELLLDLGRRLGIVVHFEPGALDRVAARERQVDLVQRGITVRQILELIVGRTGLWYEVVEDGIVVGSTPSSEAEAAVGKSSERPRVVAILRVPVGDDGTTIDFLIRDDEVPAEFVEFRARKLPEVIEVLRQRLGE